MKGEILSVAALVRPMTALDIPDLCALVGGAFVDRRGHVPARYRPALVRSRLQWSLDSAASGGPVTLVAELGGHAVGMGQYGPARWAGAAWEMMLGATRPDLQGKGIGHALVMARMEAIAQGGGGLVFVSARQAQRWRRYGFEAGPVNPLTGATTLWRFVGEGRG